MMRENFSHEVPGAMHSHDKMMLQVQQLCQSGTVTSVSGNTLRLNPDTLCIHGDNETSVKAITDIKAIAPA